jgi:hypothetical protein
MNNISALVDKFTNHAKSKGIELLKGDYDHVKNCLRFIPINLRQSVLLKYLDIWQKLMGECESEIAASNLGRRHANFYIREYANEFRTKAQGQNKVV